MDNGSSTIDNKSGKRQRTKPKTVLKSSTQKGASEQKPTIEEMAIILSLAQTAKTDSSLAKQLESIDRSKLEEFGLKRISIKLFNQALEECRETIRRTDMATQQSMESGSSVGGAGTQQGATAGSVGTIGTGGTICGSAGTFGSGGTFGSAGAASTPLGGSGAGTQQGATAGTGGTIGTAGSVCGSVGTAASLGTAGSWGAAVK